MIDFKQAYSKSDFAGFLEGFLPEDYKVQSESLDIPFQAKYFDKVSYLGESNNLTLAVYEVQHSSENDARVGLTREMFRLMAAFGKRRALVILVPKEGNSYRFSLVTIDLKIDEKNKIKRDYSNPKRYSFILGENAKTHTPEKFLIAQGRVTDFEDLQKRFSVEVVNKEFYNQIAVMFSRLVGGKRKQGSRTQNYDHILELPSTPYENNEQKYKEFAVRLIGRTVFCWFFKKKKSVEGIPLIPEDVLSTFAISFNPNYYHGRVEPLFFNVLNTPVNDRTTEFKQQPYNKIPFLNGGLFEPQPDDFYTGNQPNYALKIPDQWWKDFIGILETYNFTIDENTSIDIDLSVDPEMLGRIFENLLAEINPETGESARKSTGSYYTPRPIVEYMVDESLKQYLVTKTGIDENNLETLLDYSREESGLQAEQETKIVKALNEIKVLDPACGSGAFPMGILQKMLLILQKVDHDAKNSIEQILNDIKDPVYRKLLESKLKAAQVYDDEDLDDYARKLNIIRRSIYGVDIQPVAIDIAKLRFFLSIIVDEVIQDDLPNRGIEPLPNLEFKFVCANTLIPLPPNRELFENIDAIEKLEELRDKYFISFGSEKLNIKKEFRKVQAQMFNTSINLLNRESGSHNSTPQTQTQMLATWNPFINESSTWFDPKWMFGEKNGFDVVIGNPPYGILNKKQNKAESIVISDKELNFYKENEYYKPATGGMLNIFRLFILKSIYLLSSDGVFSEIFPLAFVGDLSISNLRKYILKNKKILFIEAFPERDNPNKRIFEAVKMSVCILNLQNTKSDTDFFIRINDDKYIDKNANKNFLNFNDISILDDKYLTLPLCSKTKTNLLLKIYSKSLKIKDIGHCNTGEADMTFCKEYFSENSNDAPMLKGAIIDRYILRSKMSQGEIVYLKEKEFLANKKNIDYTFRKNKRIVLQGITGVNERNRIKMMLIENAYCANSLNYLSFNSPVNLYYILGYLNSKLINFIFSIFSTNSNVNGYEVDNLPLLKNISDENISAIKNKVKIILKEKVEGITHLLETQIDLMVYKLYELTYDEALLVDPELPGIISQEDYEKAGIEELAEWKFN